MPFLMHGPRQDGAYLAGTTRNNDFHKPASAMNGAPGLQFRECLLLDPQGRQRCGLRLGGACFLIVNMFTENCKPGKRGRPAGRSAEGEATKTRLYETAIQLIAECGYEAATLREVAERAGVSPGLLYRYFPSKRALVLALYDELSLRLVEQAVTMPEGRWRDRFLFALRLSLEVLWPHRETLRALVPVIAGHGDDGLFATSTRFSRERVEGVFDDAVRGASDAPKQPLPGSLGRLLYLTHLGVILWWLLDRSSGQEATKGMVALIARGLPALALSLRLPAVKAFVRSADKLYLEGLLQTETESPTAPN
jgi:AcrR family transcriptional regulator